MVDTKQMAKYIFEEYANYYSEVDIEKLAKHLDGIKAEAVKQFAERLKETANGRMYRKDVVYIVEIDNLVKEMVGEQNVPCN